MLQELLMMISLQLIYVPVYTLRTILMVKGNTKIAVPLGFLETLIYISAVSIVLNGDQNIAKMLVYSSGFAVGLYIGSVFEKKLAVGYISLNVNIQNKNEQLITNLREEGYGVTVFEGQGRDSNRYKLEIVCKRSNQKKLIERILKTEEGAFITAYEPIEFQGGYIVKQMKKFNKKVGK
jgi:uncharacterized protein YebE (UPF0316 family)